MKIKEKLHLKGIHRVINLFFINYVFRGTKPFVCEIKRKLLSGIGCTVGEGTTIVGPIECKGTILIGKNCWIGKNCKINGNGTGNYSLFKKTSLLVCQTLSLSRKL